MFFRASRKTQPVDTFAFPTGPDFVPDGLTAPTPGYKRNATLAMLSLGGFMPFYLALMIWFGWSAWAIFRDMAVMPDLNIMLGCGWRLRIPRDLHGQGPVVHPARRRPAGL